ncbi:MAG: DUF4203 domain-containing protein [Fusicatenibacter sp.]|nr:DUF4203 domain-containing protein [Lachnospiraceae bacterium]MDY2936861.1 DUF4203 domain-containing protein [Fusicatenibacter sp.]
MNYLNMETLNRLLDHYDSLKIALQSHEKYVIAAIILFALMNCFFGYGLRKLWSILFGLGSGTVFGMFLCTRTDLSYQMQMVFSLCFGLLCAAIALALYRIGMFFLIITLAAFSLWNLLHPTDLAGIGILCLISLAVGFLSVPFERIAVIFSTGICGSILAVRMAYYLKGIEPNQMMWIVIAVLSALGILFQLKPWKEDDSKERREELEAQRRHHARERRKNSYGIGSSSAKKKKRKHKKRTSSGNFGNRTRVSQNTMYDFRFVPEEPDNDEVLSEDPETDTQPDYQEADPFPSKEQPRSSMPDVDLSDVRQQISAEIQQIYREDQEKNSDHTK